MCVCLCVSVCVGMFVFLSVLLCAPALQLKQQGRFWWNFTQIVFRKWATGSVVFLRFLDIPICFGYISIWLCHGVMVSLFVCSTRSIKVAILGSNHFKLGNVVALDHLVFAIENRQKSVRNFRFLKRTARRIVQVFVPKLPPNSKLSDLIGEISKWIRYRISSYE